MEALSHRPSSSLSISSSSSSSSSSKNTPVHYASIATWLLLIVLAAFLIIHSWESPRHGRLSSSMSLLAPSTINSHSPTAVRDRPLCRNTQQGKLYITDDRGYLCRWTQTTSDGCCNLTQASVVDRFSCDYCNEDTNCCMIYEYCVSCCVGPDKRDLVIQTLNMTNNLLYRATSSLFDFCRARCRTSSATAVGHKQYLSTERFCYGPEPPGVAPTSGDFEGNGAVLGSRSMLEGHHSNHADQEIYQTPSGLVAVFDDIPSNHWSLGANSAASLQLSRMWWLVPLVVVALLLLQCLSDNDANDTSKTKTKDTTQQDVGNNLQHKEKSD